MNSYFGQAPVFGDFPSQVITSTGTTIYNLDFKVSSENGVLVFLNGAVQRPGIDFTASGNVITFSEVVPVGVQIFVYGMGLPKSTLAPSAGSVGPAEVQAGLFATEQETIDGVVNNKAVSPASLALTLESMPRIGYGQTWQDMTASRANGTTYTNTTGRSIQLFITFDPFGTATHHFSIDGVNILPPTDNTYYHVACIVPAGSTYRMGTLGTAIQMKWMELR